MTCVGGAEAGPEDEVERLGFAQPRGFFGRRQSQFDGLGANLLRVDAAAVVGDFDDDLIAVVIGVQPDDALRRLAQFAALFGRLNAVAHRVAHQMGERLGDGVENSFVEIGVLPADDQVRLRGRIAATRRAPCAGSGGTTDRPGTMRIFMTERCRSLSTRAWKAMASANLPRNGSFG